MRRPIGAGAGNTQEKLAREIGRRTDEVGSFRGRNALIGRLSAVIAGQHDEVDRDAPLHLP
jgi:hypothetical protein